MLRPDLLHLMRVFRAVVQHGSFTSAARSLGVQSPAVSKAIAKLETDLGMQLLIRSTRSVGVTDGGKLLYDEAIRILADLEDTYSAVKSRSPEPSGTLRLSATVAFGEVVLAPLLPKFMLRHPGVAIDLRLTNDLLNLNVDDTDLVLRSTPRLENNALFGRLVCTQSRAVLASPAYLEEYGRPSHPAELERHKGLVFKAGLTFNKWKFSIDGQHVDITVRPALISNNYAALVEAAKGGVGVARVFDYQVGGELQRGTLVRLFEEYELPHQNIYALYRQKRRQSPKVNAFITFLEESLKSDLG